MPRLSVTPWDESKDNLWIKSQGRHEDRQSPECSDDFRLADGRPLWYTLLNDPNALVMDAADADRARAELRDLFRTQPNIVRKCVNGSLEEARRDEGHGAIFRNLAGKKVPPQPPVKLAR